MKKLHYNKAEHIKKRLHNIFEFSHIRIQKILEMSQEGFVSFCLSLIVGVLFNRYSFSLNKNEDIIIIIFKILFELLLLIILFYYLRKFVMLFPFLFHYTNSYIPSRPSSDGEGLLGKTIAMAIVFGNILDKLKEKIKFVSRFLNQSFTI